MSKKIAAIALIVLITLSLSAVLYLNNGFVHADSSCFETSMVINYFDAPPKMFQSGHYTDIPQTYSLTDYSFGKVDFLTIFLSVYADYTLPSGVNLTGYVASGTVDSYLKMDVSGHAGAVITTITQDAPLGPFLGATLPPNIVIPLYTSEPISYLFIQGTYPSWRVGDTYHYIWELNNFSLVLSFSDGSTKTITSSEYNNIDWKFSYTGGVTFNSLTVSFGKSATYN